MNFFKYSLITLLTLLFIGSAGYLLAASGMKSKPGYADLSFPNWSATSTSLTLDLGPTGIKPIRWMINQAVNSRGVELELGERISLSLLQELQGVQLRVFEIENNRDIYDQAIAESVSSLQQNQWQILLKVKEDDKNIIVMQSTDNGTITGLSILASTPEKAVFMNVMGRIDSESIATIAKVVH